MVVEGGGGDIKLAQNERQYFERDCLLLKLSQSKSFDVEWPGWSLCPHQSLLDSSHTHIKVIVQLTHQGETRQRERDLAP